MQGGSMKGSMLNTTTTYVIVAFGVMTFVYFGVSSFMGLTHSADVVSKNLESMYAVDTAHILFSCLEGDDGIITELEITNLKARCEALHKGLEEVNYGYQISDYDQDFKILSTNNYQLSGDVHEHSLYLAIVMDNNEVHIGRFDVKVE
jgi:hypothetical protein